MASSGEEIASLSSAFTQDVLRSAPHDSPLRLKAASTQFMSPQYHYRQHISQKIRTGFQSSATSRVLWIGGPAGVGKTALMQSLAEALLPPSDPLAPDKDEPKPSNTEDTKSGRVYVGTTFFFSRENETTDPQRFFTTLAYGLALRVPALTPFIQYAFDNNKGVLNMPLERQCELLLLDPIRSWVQSTQDKTDMRLLMIIDGLEECDGGKETHLDIIRIIHQAFDACIGGVRWLWLISSRMEAWIYSASLQLVTSPQSRHVLISLASNEDISTYIRKSFASAYNSHPLPFRMSPGSKIVIRSPASSLASERDIETLCWQSGGYFAYAASLVHYILDPDSQHSKSQRLRGVIQHTKYNFLQSPHDHHFSKLDAMYHDILARVPLGSQEITKRVLGAISLMQPSSPEDALPSSGAMAALLDITFDDLCKALYHLHSIVAAPLNPEPIDFGKRAHDPIDTALHFYHKSFNDFLRDPSRSRDWAIDLEAMHADLAKCYIKHIQDSENLSASKKWFIHCWRTGTDTDAAFGMLPELYNFDYTLLLGKGLIDRYFVKWLLHLEELTMSEYLILNEGPEYSLEVTTRFGFPARRRLPSRPTYILGLEPSKQVLLVPVFDEKDQHREDVGRKIGPREKHWDLIRGFQVVSIWVVFERTDGGEDAEAEADANAETEVAGAYDVGRDPIIWRIDEEMSGVDDLIWDNRMIAGEEDLVRNEDAIRNTKEEREAVLADTPADESASTAKDTVEQEGTNIAENVGECEGLSKLTAENGSKDLGEDIGEDTTAIEEEFSDSEVVIVSATEELDLDDDSFEWIEREEEKL